MQIILNGEKTTVDHDSNITQILEKLGLNPGQVAVEVNREIVNKAKWIEYVLNEGDQVEIVHFVGGGGDE